MNHPRRFTSSREKGRFIGNQFPITGEPAPDVNPSTWRLAINGAVEKPLVLNYDSLLIRPMWEWTATIDCTLGWYSVQAWQGVSLAELLREAGLLPERRAIRLKSTTGCAAAFPMFEAQQILLATHVGGETLGKWHGYPLCAVVPFRRGWFWIKWLSEITVLTDPVNTKS